MKNALGFVGGFTTVFVAMGALAGTLGSFLKEYQTLVNIVTGLIVVFFGLSFLGVFRLNLFKGSSRSMDKSTLNFFSSYLFGKPIVLNFWASWCPPCKSEMPHFEAAYLVNPDIQFLMVNMTSSDNIDDAKAFIAESGYTFPVLFDTTGEAGYIYQATSLPMTMFIDANGALVTYAIGMLSEENLNQGLEMIKTAAG